MSETTDAILRGLRKPTWVIPEQKKGQMKSTRKLEGVGNKVYSIHYSRFPQEGEDIMVMTEWEGGDGFDIATCDGKIELTQEELAALVALYGQSHMLDK